MIGQRRGRKSTLWSFYISQAPGAAQVSLAACQEVVFRRLFMVFKSC